MSYDVFLSHNSKDKPFVRPIANWLKDHLGAEKVFFDERDITFGQVIPAALEKALQHSSSALVCFGEKGVGPWHDQEVWALLTKAIQQSHHSKDQEDFRLIPLLLPGANPDDIPWLLKTRLWADFRTGGIEGNQQTLERLAMAVRGEKGISDVPVLPKEDNPFRGLEPFTEAVDEHGRGDHLYFCGRDKQCRDLAARLKRERAVLVSGASGNGKSSLARAGLRTAAAEEGCPGIKLWHRIHFFPGHDFFHSFANALVPKSDAGLDGDPELVAKRGSIVSELTNRFERPVKWDESTGATCAGSWAQTMFNILCERFLSRESDRVLVILDQLEELFTHPHPAFQNSKEHHQRMAGLLTAIALFHSFGDPRFHIVATLRADFRARCHMSSAFWDFIAAKDSTGRTWRHMMLDELDPEGWREAIKSPAERAGAYFEPGLTGSILKDVYRQRGSMPLLQHALAELWKHPAGACLSHESYERIGGVQSALQRTADTVLVELSTTSDTHAILCQNLFLRLVSFGEGVPDTRRRAGKAEFEFGSPYDELLPIVLKRLVDERLVVEDENAIEVTHEALIRECDSIRRWIEDARLSNSVGWHRALTDAANAWAGDGRARQYLWHSDRLSEFYTLIPPRN